MKMKNLLRLNLYLTLLLSMIITVYIMHDLPIEYLLLIIIGIIATTIATISSCIKFRKTSNNEYVPIHSTNNLTRVVTIISIALSTFIILFAATISSSLDHGYGIFGAFVLYLFDFLILIWISTWIIHLFIRFFRFIGNHCSELSPKILSFFIANLLISCLFIFVLTIPTGSLLAGFGYGIVFTLSIVLFINGIAVAFLYRSNLLRFISGFLSVIGFIIIIVILRFYLNDGFNMSIDVLIPSERFPTNFTSDPSLDGDYSYSVLTYGSGFDRRIDYGSNASIITPTIDLSTLIELSSFNQQFFKFNASLVPLNGRIWYPNNGNGPCPIVVMVHGNHLSTKSSEFGYDYLCQMLASQGFLAVSIDENFLNDGPLGSSMSSEKLLTLKKYFLPNSNSPQYIARAVIILETLKQFRIWNYDRTNQFYNQLDLSNIGLMGHSRGGEAIVIASILNKLHYLPEYPSTIRFTNYNFSIKALYSIAGTSDAYIPLGRYLTLSDVTLFVIHGIYDGDVSEFRFQSIISNLKFLSTTKQNFKASLYVHQANHAQFNTDWGRYDLKYRTKQFLNVRPLMKIEDQQHICKIYMSALMKFVLKNQNQYQILFEDYRLMINYLPYTNYISTYQDSNEIMIANFENYDVTKGTIDGSTINVTNLFLWSSVYVQPYTSSMLLIQSKNDSTGIYRIHLSNPLRGLKLRFMVGRTQKGLANYLRVRLVYADTRFDLFNVQVRPILTKQLFKISSEEYVFALQTISLPTTHPIVTIDFLVNGINAQFFIDNVVLVK